MKILVALDLKILLEVEIFLMVYKLENTSIVVVKKDESTQLETELVIFSIA